MASYVALSRSEHGGRKWRRVGSYLYARSEALVPVLAAELGRAALAMPLAFFPQDGRYALVGMTSFVPGGNLFVSPEGKWAGGYVPALLRAYPFRLMGKSGTDERIVAYDEDSNLLVDADKPEEEFFDSEGKPSVAMQACIDFLGQVERNQAATNASVGMLAATGVIRPWNLSLKNDGRNTPIGGLYSVDEQALESLSDQEMIRIRKALPIAYAQLLSRGQIVILEQLAHLQAQVKAATGPKAPFSFDAIFGQPNEDIVNFDAFLRSP